MSQVSGEAEGRPPGKGPWLCTAKNSRVTQSEREVGLFRELHIPQTECGGPVSEHESGLGVWGSFVFKSWVIHRRMSGRIISPILEMSRNWTSADFFGF